MQIRSTSARRATWSARVSQCALRPSWPTRTVARWASSSWRS